MPRPSPVHAYEHVPCLGDTEEERTLPKPLCGGAKRGRSKAWGDEDDHLCAKCTAAVETWHR